MASLGTPHRPLCAVLMSALILGLLFMAVYSLSHGEITYDPLYAGESLGDGGKQGCLEKGLHSRLGANQDSPSVFEGFLFNCTTQRAWNTDWRTSQGLLFQNWNSRENQLCLN